MHVASLFRVMSLLAACAMFSVSAHASRGAGDVIVEVVDSHGAVFQQVPTKRDGRAYRAYLEAERDARYRIRIRNSTGARVGVVVAVDGRNIISGARSELGNSEPMYILDGWNTQEYSGWRANLSEVNEFYFTEWKDSYAEAFGDRSARGVIAVAVYREKESKRFAQELERRARGSAGAANEAPVAAATPAPADSSAGESNSAGNGRDQAAASVAQGERQAKKAERSDAGTGYGDRRTEYVTQVEFDAESRASQRVFLKYEWRENLCSRRILSCDEPSNRFWPNDSYGFAPPPPRR
jgi:pyruvate/2-oxoglutarate dehydrogenase complex dihydrolipoamide acyltransferase (E2) component